MKFSKWHGFFMCNFGFLKTRGFFMGNFEKQKIRGAARGTREKYARVFHGFFENQRGFSAGFFKNKKPAGFLTII